MNGIEWEKNVKREEGQMKAWVLHGTDHIKLETLETSVPGNGEVLVKVKAAGICGSGRQSDSNGEPLFGYGT